MRDWGLGLGCGEGMVLDFLGVGRDCGNLSEI